MGVDSELLKKMGITPISKSHRYERNTDDVTLYMSKPEPKTGKCKALVSINADIFNTAFESEYLGFGLSDGNNRLYLWNSDSEDGYKVNKNSSSATYGCSSVPLYKTLYKYFDEEYYRETYKLLYESSVGMYYIQLGQKRRK